MTTAQHSDSAIIHSITNLLVAGDYATAHSLTTGLTWRAALQQQARIRAAERAALRLSAERHALAQSWMAGQVSR